MNCPSCDGATRVIDTTKYKDRVVRVRRCTECSAVMTTHEILRQVALVDKATPAQAENTLRM